MLKLKKIPKFKSEQKERLFWQKEDSTHFIDWGHAKFAQLPNLKLSTKSISLRLPEGLLNEIKVVANKRDIPYQSLMKMLLTQGLQVLQKA